MAPARNDPGPHGLGELTPTSRGLTLYPRHRSRLLAVLVGAALVGSAAVAAPAAVAGPVPFACATTNPPGGDWPMMGHDLTGTRVQDKDFRVTTPVLPVWTFDANRATHARNNEVTGYPIVAGGCVYVGTSTGNRPDGQHLPGWVVALNADTGDVVWRTQLDGGVYSTVAVDNGVVYAFVSVIGAPTLVALDQRTGDVLWQTIVDNQVGSDAVSSPMVYDHMVWVGVSGTAAEGDAADRSAFEGSSVLVATDGSHGYAAGQIIRKIWTIPQDRWAQGYAGGSQWGNISIDPTTGAGYIGTGNPFDYEEEDPHTNAVLKLDLNWASPTFGTVTGTYKGDVEQFFPALAAQKPCAELGQIDGVFALGLDCLHLDLDFGTAPNIFTAADGRRVVAAGQKSGVLHFFDAATMAPIDKVLLGVPSPVGGIVGGTAFDGKNLYGPHSIGGYLWSVNASSHGTNWVSPVADGVHWGPPVTMANKVLYTVDLKGFLDAYDAATGLPIQHLPMALGSDTRENPTLSWGGVSVARNMVFASVGVGLSSAGLPSTPNGFVIAYAPVGKIA